MSDINERANGMSLYEAQMEYGDGGRDGHGIDMFEGNNEAAHRHYMIEALKERVRDLESSNGRLRDEYQVLSDRYMNLQKLVAEQEALKATEPTYFISGNIDVDEEGLGHFFTTHQMSVEPLSKSTKEDKKEKDIGWIWFIGFNLAYMWHQVKKNVKEFVEKYNFRRY